MPDRDINLPLSSYQSPGLIQTPYGNSHPGKTVDSSRAHYSKIIPSSERQDPSELEAIPLPTFEEILDYVRRMSARKASGLPDDFDLDSDVESNVPSNVQTPRPPSFWNRYMPSTENLSILVFSISIAALTYYYKSLSPEEIAEFVEKYSPNFKNAKDLFNKLVDYYKEKTGINPIPSCNEKECCEILENLDKNPVKNTVLDHCTLDSPLEKPATPSTIPNSPAPAQASLVDSVISVSSQQSTIVSSFKKLDQLTTQYTSSPSPQALPTPATAEQVAKLFEENNQLEAIYSQPPISEQLPTTTSTSVQVYKDVDSLFKTSDQLTTQYTSSPSPQALPTPATAEQVAKLFEENNQLQAIYSQPPISEQLPTTTSTSVQAYKDVDSLFKTSDQLTTQYTSSPSPQALPTPATAEQVAKLFEENNQLQAIYSQSPISEQLPTTTSTSVQAYKDVDSLFKTSDQLTTQYTSSPSPQALPTPATAEQVAKLFEENNQLQAIYSQPPISEQLPTTTSTSVQAYKDVDSLFKTSDQLTTQYTSSPSPQALPTPATAEQVAKLFEENNQLEAIYSQPPISEQLPTATSTSVQVNTTSTSDPITETSSTYVEDLFKTQEALSAPYTSTTIFPSIPSTGTVDQTQVTALFDELDTLSEKYRHPQSVDFLSRTPLQDPMYLDDQLDTTTNSISTSDPITETSSTYVEDLFKTQEALSAPYTSTTISPSFPGSTDTTDQTQVTALFDELDTLSEKYRHPQSVDFSAWAEEKTEVISKAISDQVEKATGEEARTKASQIFFDFMLRRAQAARSMAQVTTTLDQQRTHFVQFVVDSAYALSDPIRKKVAGYNEYLNSNEFADNVRMTVDSIKKATRPIGQASLDSFNHFSNWMTTTLWSEHPSSIPQQSNRTSTQLNSSTTSPIDAMPNQDASLMNISDSQSLASYARSVEKNIQLPAEDLSGKFTPITSDFATSAKDQISSFLNGIFTHVSNENTTGPTVDQVVESSKAQAIAENLLGAPSNSTFNSQAEPSIVSPTKPSAISDPIDAQITTLFNEADALSAQYPSLTVPSELPSNSMLALPEDFMGSIGSQSPVQATPQILVENLQENTNQLILTSPSHPINSQEPILPEIPPISDQELLALRNRGFEGTFKIPTSLQHNSASNSTTQSPNTLQAYLAANPLPSIDVHNLTQENKTGSLPVNIEPPFSLRQEQPSAGQETLPPEDFLVVQQTQEKTPQDVQDSIDIARLFEELDELNNLYS